MFDGIDKIALNASSELTIITLLIASGILAWIRINYPKRVPIVFNALLKKQYLNQMMREEMIFSTGGSIGLLLLFYLEMALFIFFCHQHFNWHFLLGSPLLVLIKSIGIVTAVYSIKSGCIKLIQFIVRGDFSLNQYGFLVYIFNETTALVLFPCIFFICLSPTSSVVVYISIVAGLLLLIFLYRLVKGFLSAIEYHVPIYYIIFYLCALEILPLALVYKTLSLSLIQF